MRDAFAKGVYGRLFIFIVNRLLLFEDQLDRNLYHSSKTHRLALVDFE